MVCLVRKSDEALLDKEITGDPVPNYIRTREVIFREINVGGTEHVLMKCGCDYFTRIKGPCRHFYAIVDRTPEPGDFSPECLKSYELFYQEDEEYTQKADATIDLMESHGGLVLKTTLSEFKKGMEKQCEDLEGYLSMFNELGVDTTPRDVNLAQKLPSCASSPSTRSSLLSRLANSKKQSAYTRTHKAYHLCTDMASSEADVQDITDTLSDLHFRILSRKKKTTNPAASSVSSVPEVEKSSEVIEKSNHVQSSVSSLPEVEKSNKVPRIEPFSQGGSHRKRKG